MVKAEVPAVLADPKLAFNLLQVEQELIYMCAPEHEVLRHHFTKICHLYLSHRSQGELKLFIFLFFFYFQAFLPFPPHVVTVKVSVSHLPILFAVPLVAAAVCDPLVMVVTVTGLFRAGIIYI